MKKPLHWRKEGDENKAILSAMGLLHPFETLCMLEQKCSMDDIQSALWGIWVEKSIILRPHVYSQFKLGKQIYERIIQRVGKVHRKTEPEIELEKYQPGTARKIPEGTFDEE